MAIKWILAIHLTASFAFAEESKKLPDRPARNSSRDVKLPRGFIESIEGEYHAYLKTQGVIAETLKRQMLNVSVELTEGHAATALNENARITTPLGGGVVDLADFVTPLRGSFNLRFLVRREDGSEPTGLRVSFVSRAKTRILAGEEYGAGCNKLMDISSYFYKTSSHGVDLYTADQRYLSVIGGTFVIVAFDKEALSVASLTFTDSRYPALLCE